MVLHDDLHTRAGRAVTAVQFHDRLVQCLTHVCSSLSYLAEFISSGSGPKSDAEWNELRECVRGIHSMEQERIPIRSAEPRRYFRGETSGNRGTSGGRKRRRCGRTLLSEGPQYRESSTLRRPSPIRVAARHQSRSRCSPERTGRWWQGVTAIHFDHARNRHFQGFAERNAGNQDVRQVSLESAHALVLALVTDSRGHIVGEPPVLQDSLADRCVPARYHFHEGLLVAKCIRLSDRANHDVKAANPVQQPPSGMPHQD